MKRLRKHAPPQVMIANASTWTANYLGAKPSERSSHEKWRNDSVKAALDVETNGMCAYCEAYMADVSYPHVEHILPKVRFPELAHEWDNLTRVCPVCNTEKSDYYEPSLMLLNPYLDAVDDRLWFLGPILDWDGDDDQAEATAEQVGLNRDALLKSRTQRLKAVQKAVHAWEGANGPKRIILEAGLRLDAREGEFSRAVICLLRQHGLFA